MDCIKKNVDTLFLKADSMNPDELESTFNAIMKEGEKSVEQSGKPCFFLDWGGIEDYILRVADFRGKSSISQPYA